MGASVNRSIAALSLACKKFSLPALSAWFLLSLWVCSLPVGIAEADVHTPQQGQAPSSQDEPAVSVESVAQNLVAGKSALAEEKFAQAIDAANIALRQIDGFCSDPLWAEILAQAFIVVADSSEQLGLFAESERAYVDGLTALSKCGDTDVKISELGLRIGYSMLLESRKRWTESISQSNVAAEIAIDIGRFGTAARNYASIGSANMKIDRAFEAEQAYEACVVNARKDDSMMFEALCLEDIARIKLQRIQLDTCPNELDSIVGLFNEAAVLYEEIGDNYFFRGAQAGAEKYLDILQACNG